MGLSQQKSIRSTKPRGSTSKRRAQNSHLPREIADVDTLARDRCGIDTTNVTIHPSIPLLSPHTNKPGTLPSEEGRISTHGTSRVGAEKVSNRDPGEDRPQITLNPSASPFEPSRISDTSASKSMLTYDGRSSSIPVTIAIMDPYITSLDSPQNDLRRIMDDGDFIPQKTPVETKETRLQESSKQNTSSQEDSRVTVSDKQSLVDELTGVKLNKAQMKATLQAASADKETSATLAREAFKAKVPDAREIARLTEVGANNASVRLHR
jgi:hypothetical protein